MRKLWPVLGVLFLLISMNACVSPKKLYYFHDKMPGKDKIDSIKQVVRQRIQVKDRLNITVSSTDPALTAYLNPFTIQNSNSATQQTNTGYLVNDTGSIEFPLLGQVAVAGLTTVEAAGRIRDKLSFYYKDLFVSVILRGQVYFINGRMGTPIPMINERLTIFEAISQSGTQDPFDLKNDVWLVRDSSNGERVYAKLDVNSQHIFQSPYYYLQNNDLIYVKPNKYSSFFGPTSPARNILAVSGAILAIILALRAL